MTLTIPAWLVWTLGLLLGVPIVAAIIVFGFVVAKAFSKREPWQ